MPNFAQKIDGVVDLLGRGKEDEIDDNEFIEATRLVYDGVREIRHAVLLNRGLGDDDPEDEWAKIEQEVVVFKEEKRKFDIEVSKWDDNGNDIIVLAKHMCMIMMEMTDFTRGRGPLQTTMGVINAAKRISEAGTKLDKLAG